MRNRKIYISGPVTGIPGGNLAAFLDVNVIAILIAAGAVGFIASRTGRKG